MTDKITSLAGLRRKLAKYEHDGSYDTTQENKAYRDGIDEALDKINEFEAGLKDELAESERALKRARDSNDEEGILWFIPVAKILRRILGGETAAGGGT